MATGGVAALCRRDGVALGVREVVVAVRESSPGASAVPPNLGAFESAAGGAARWASGEVLQLS